MAEAVARHHLPASVRVGSCGVYKGTPDPFVRETLMEVGIAPPSVEPREFAECDTDNYEVIVALTPEAASEARRFHRNVQFWEVENPTDTRGSEDEIRDAYRRLRKHLTECVKENFGAS
jgi:protein-tyrosine-phosphatase